MREHEKKEYCRIVRNHHAQFVGGYALPVGAVYGRIWIEERAMYVYFVWTNHAILDDRIWVELKVDEFPWQEERITIASRIAQRIWKCVREENDYQFPEVKTYNAYRKEEVETLDAYGKTYEVCKVGATEVEVPEEIKGMIDGLPQSKQYNAKRMKPEHTRYAVKYRKKYHVFDLNGAKEYCAEKGIPESEIIQFEESEKGGDEYRNEVSFWDCGVDANRNVDAEEAGERIKKNRRKTA